MYMWSQQLYLVPHSAQAYSCFLSMKQKGVLSPPLDRCLSNTGYLPLPPPLPSHTHMDTPTEKSFQINEKMLDKLYGKSSYSLKKLL